MSRSLHDAFRSQINRKVKECQLEEDRLFQADCTLLLDLLADKFAKNLDEGDNFTVLNISTFDLRSFHYDNMFCYAESLGFIVSTETCNPNIPYALTIPEFTSGEGQKMTIAQKRLRSFNAALKKARKQMCADITNICKILSDKMKNGDFAVTDADSSMVKILYPYIRNEENKKLNHFEISIIHRFFRKQKITFWQYNHCNGKWTFKCN